MRTAVLAAILTLLLAGTAFANDGYTCPNTPICAPTVIESIQIQEHTAGYNILINYPVLCSDQATRTIRDYVTTTLADFKLEFPEHDLTQYPHKNEMTISHAVWPAAKGAIASVKLQSTIYTGGAHPNHWPVTWVFDMSDGKQIELDDIFWDKDKALKSISCMVRSVLAASLGTMYSPDMLRDGTAPIEKNYRNFIVNDEGIAFFFAPYQVAPYAAGQQVVTVPWGAISKRMKKSFRRLIGQ